MTEGRLGVIVPLIRMDSYFSPRMRLRLGWACFLVHAVALLAVLAVLQRGIPPGDLALRAAWVASHSFAWRIGWALWLPASLVLLLFFAAWADALGVRMGAGRAWAALALGLTLAGAVVDWVDEMIWIGLAPDLAARFTSDAFAASLYALWDRAYLVLSIGLANGLYTIGGIILTALAFRTRGFPRWLAAWGAAVWALSIGLSLAGVVGDGWWVQAVSTLLFAAFMPWVILTAYGWLARGSQVNPPAWRTSFPAVVRSIVPKHPIPMQTVFRECFLVNFAVKPEALAQLVPWPIQLDLASGMAYLSIVIAKMDKMRPAFLPRELGISYLQVVYRVVVRSPRGERGVYFVRSDANNPLMSLAGDWLTFFRFHHSQIRMERADKLVNFDLEARPGDHANIHAAYDLSTATETMPKSSAFSSLEQAKEFLVQLFAAFSYDPLEDRVSVVRIERGEWNVKVLADSEACYEWMQHGTALSSATSRLDSIFYVRDLPYLWHTLTHE